MPKTRKPQQERSRQTVAAIVEAGLLCIQQHGVEGTTTRKIADAAGIGVGSLYEYFSNELYFSELLNFNNMESISELMSKDLINNIRVKLHQKTLNKFKYLCKNCGYKTIKLSWQCPTCRSWELSTPINFIRNH